MLDDDALIDGAITNLDQLGGTTALVDIPSNHQISANHVEQLDEPTLSREGDPLERSEHVLGLASDAPVITTRATRIGS